MSKNIIIAKDGEAMTLQGVDTLRTSAVGGGSVDWMPEDETTLAEITVTENGTYTADSRSVYGFSRAIVNVPPNEVTGYINGVKYVVSVDANGYLVYTRVD